MAAVDDAERVLPVATTQRPDCASPAPVEPTRLLTRHFIAVVSALSGIQLLATMDGTVAIFALPKIQIDLGLSDATRSWVISIYVLASGGLLLLGGRIGDTIGHKRTLIIGAALFTITSAMCGIAWDGDVLILARLLKGVAAAYRHTDRYGAGSDHVPEGARAQHRDGGIRHDGQCRVGGGPGGGWSAHRDVLAAGVFGERADRAAGDLPGQLRAAGNREGADEARRSRGCAGHVGLHRGGFLHVDGCGAWVVVGHHARFESGGAGSFRSVRPGGAHGREPHRAVKPVLRPQPDGHVRDPVPLWVE